MLENMLIRTGEPSKYDQSPFGTICKRVKTMDDTFEIYVQLSEDDSVPCWEKVGIFSSETNDKIQEEVERIVSVRRV